MPFSISFRSWDRRDHDPWAVITLILGDYSMAVKLIIVYLIITVVREHHRAKGSWEARSAYIRW